MTSEKPSEKNPAVGTTRLQDFPLVSMPEDAFDLDEMISGFQADGAVFHERDWESLSLDHCELNHFRFLSCTIDELTCRELLFVNGDLANTRCERTYMDRVEIVHSRLTGMSLGSATIKNTRFEHNKGNLSFFRFARLTNCVFRNCDLTEANFQGASMKDVIFRNCDLSGAQFSQAHFERVDLRSSCIDGIGIGSDDARGLIVEPLQCIEFARLLGVNIGEYLEEE